MPLYSIPESNDTRHLFAFNLSKASNMTLAWCQIILFIGSRKTFDPKRVFID